MYLEMKYVDLVHRLYKFVLNKKFLEAVVSIWVHSLEYTYKCKDFVILHSVGTPVSVLSTMFTSVFVVDNTYCCLCVVMV